MIAVAVLAILLAIGVRLWRRSGRFSRLATLHYGHGLMSSSTKKIEYYLGLERKYRRAARYPFLPVEPDPPIPD